MQEEISALYHGSVSDGIFHKMTSGSRGQNPVDAGQVKFNIPVTRDPFMKPGSLVEFQDNSKIDFYNYAIEVPTQKQNWFEFDFVDRRVSISGCAITPSNRYIPVDWYLLGSADAKDWYAIELLTEGNELKQSVTTVISAVVQDNLFRYIRFVQQTNDDADQDCWYFIQLRSFELFGKVYKCQ